MSRSVADYATFESKDGLTMRFRMRQTTDTAVTEQIEGTATLDSVGGPGTIRYTLPEGKTMPLPPGTGFPMGHTEAIIAAAAAGKRFVALPIFDGTGDGASRTARSPSRPGARRRARPDPSMEGMPGGRVRIAFFDRGRRQARGTRGGQPGLRGRHEVFRQRRVGRPADGFQRLRDARQAVGVRP